MRKFYSILLIAGFLSLLVGCKKNTDTTPAATNASLIVGTYTATKTEGSNTNNGTDWVDFTKTASHEVLTLRLDNTFNSVLVATTNTTGALNLPVMGTWALSADGNTLSYVGSQDYTIKTLTSTNMVTVTKGPNQKTYVDAPTYAYYRFTYTRQ